MPYRRTVDMCHGPLLKNMLLYALPLIASGILQLLYNAADLIVVARWAGGTALAAVGSTGPLVNLIVNVFMGLATGASVIVARYYGAEDTQNVSRSVHTAISLSLISGAATLLIGVLLSPCMLQWMATPADVIGQATLYLRIYFLGMPACMVYNFGASILRAVGDTRRPLYILALSGLVNVGLNLLLVIVFHMDVAGVAVATTVSQYLSAALVVACLVSARDCYRLRWRCLRVHGDKVREILRHGIPAGVSGSLFSLSNIFIQSSINSFGSAAMSGCSAAGNLEGFVYVSMNAMQQTCLAFTGQNVGARRPERLPRIFRCSMGLVTVIGLLLGGLLLLFGEPLLSLYTAASSVDTTVSAEEILRYGMIRLSIIASTYFTCGLMEVLTGSLRAMGASWMPTLVTLAGVCGVRILWIFTAFRLLFHSLEGLFVSYPITWVLTMCILYLGYRSLRRKTMAALSAPPADPQKV